MSHLPTSHRVLMLIGACKPVVVSKLGLQAAFWDDVFNGAEAARGCCTAATGALYTWHKYGGHTPDSCKALCDQEPVCRGIEYPWSGSLDIILGPLLAHVSA